MSAAALDEQQQLQTIYIQIHMYTIVMDKIPEISRKWIFKAKLKDFFFIFCQFFEGKNKEKSFQLALNPPCNSRWARKFKKSPDQKTREIK